MRQVQYCPNCGTISERVPMTKACCPDSKPFDLPENIARQARAGILAVLYLAPAASDVLTYGALALHCNECKLNLQSAVEMVKRVGA